MKGNSSSAKISLELKQKYVWQFCIYVKVTYRGHIRVHNIFESGQILLKNRIGKNETVHGYVAFVSASLLLQ